MDVVDNFTCKVCLPSFLMLLRSFVLFIIFVRIVFIKTAQNFNRNKVFSASNVQLATKTRTEHLSEEDKRRIKKQSRTPFESFLGVAETDPKNKGTDSNGVGREELHLDRLICPSVRSIESGIVSPQPSTTTVCRNPCHVTEEEYFGPCDLEGRDVGRPAEETTKVQKLKARFWLSEDYPLSLPDQVLVGSWRNCRLEDVIVIAADTFYCYYYCY